MKKLLLLAAFVVAGQLQAVGVCAEKTVCNGTRIEGQAFQCPPCVCPEVKCPVPAETICECGPAQAIKKEVCPERQMTCGTCHKVRAHCGCKGGFNHRHHMHNTVVEETVVAPAAAATKTPKRVVRKSAAGA